VKANPAPEILRLLPSLGSSFDCASVAEIEMALKAGATADRISYGNTIKKERDIARAHELGVSLFAVDCVEEVEKIARAAPGARVFCRVLTDGEGAEWPLSRKFGCVPQMAVDVLEHAARLGLDRLWRVLPCRFADDQARCLGQGACRRPRVFEAAQQGIFLKMVNMGGGFPTRYLKDVPTAQAYGQRDLRRAAQAFRQPLPETIIEPGRGMVGNAGAIKAEVVLVSKKSDDDDVRWVYLDIGKFGGLAETMDEAIRYSIVTPRDGDAMTEPCVLAGPTCDSADVLYEKTPYPLPVSLTIGDEVLIEGTGAYTTTYSAVAFNGFEPLILRDLNGVSVQISPPACIASWGRATVSSFHGAVTQGSADDNRSVNLQ
jgi:ornithine decarboxylase